MEKIILKIFITVTLIWLSFFLNFENLKAQYISGDTICAGTATTINLFSNLPSGAIINWYSHPDPCPTTGPPSPNWTSIQTGGISCPTGILTAKTCYIATVNQGGTITSSNISSVVICQPLSIILPIVASTGLTPLSNGLHGCDLWTGSLTLPSTNITCRTTVTWEMQIDGGAPTTVNCFSTLPPCYQTEIVTLTAPPVLSPQCTYKYTFTATITNECGTTTRVIDIYMDRKTVAGTITANPAPILCYNGFTVLNYSGGCGDIVQWESSDVSPYSTWQVLTGAGSSSTYWTNGLNKTTHFRVTVKNGACLQVFKTIVIKVKPALTVSLSSLNNSICGFPTPKITANLSLGYPTAGLTYKWYRNGAPVATTTLPSINPALYGSGNYYVIVIDPICGSVQSDWICICGKPIVEIWGPNGICAGGTIRLDAIVESDCLDDVKYKWKKSGSSAVISPNSYLDIIHSAGTTYPVVYSVTVSCGNCSVTKKHVIYLCPPF